MIGRGWPSPPTWPVKRAAGAVRRARRRSTCVQLPHRASQCADRPAVCRAPGEQGRGGGACDPRRTCTGILRLCANTSMPRFSGSESHPMLRWPARAPPRHGLGVARTCTDRHAAAAQAACVGGRACSAARALPAPALLAGLRIRRGIEHRRGRRDACAPCASAQPPALLGSSRAAGIAGGAARGRPAGHLRGTRSGRPRGWPPSAAPACNLTPAAR